MHARERGENSLLTNRVAGVQLSKRGLQQVLQKRHGAGGQPLLQCFRRDGHRLRELCGFRRELGNSGFRRTPTAKRDQGQKHFPRNLRGPLDKLGAPRTRFNLVGGKELC
jgi:hypothetical protein